MNKLVLVSFCKREMFIWNSGILLYVDKELVKPFETSKTNDKTFLKF